jgi:L-ribulose-5-phosphate 4-epimerase
MLTNLRNTVCELNIEIKRNNLVALTLGNVSARDFQTNLVVIKPSGVPYDELTPDKLVVVDLNGTIIEGRYRPSVDMATHLYVYKHRNDIGGVVHTHSPYASSFAVIGKPLPVYMTAMADEFGCSVPVGKLAPIGGEDIGKEIIKSIGKSPVILMKQHGVFTVGSTAESALRAAILVEDVAKIAHLALSIGKPDPIPKSIVDKLHTRYKTKYGQK